MKPCSALNIRFQEPLPPCQRLCCLSKVSGYINILSIPNSNNPLRPTTNNKLSVMDFDKSASFDRQMERLTRNLDLQIASSTMMLQIWETFALAILESTCCDLVISICRQYSEHNFQFEARRPVSQY